MLSIAIPTYNYSISLLVETLIEQASKLDVPWEVLIYEDASKEFLSENKEVSKHPLVQYSLGKNNVGRTQARQELAKKAQYSYILFLDADVLPVKEDFLKQYTNVINTGNPEVVFGGIQYQKNYPQGTELRWKFGAERESKKASERKENPFFIISQNLLIQKDLFLQTNTTTENTYGLDNVFSFQLKKLKIIPLHIDNPTYHLGLESNASFLKKSLLAVHTLAQKTKSKNIDSNFTRLQQAHIQLKKYYLLGVFSMFAKLFKSKMERNILGANPNLRYFDYYRLFHYDQYLKKK